MTDHVPGQLLRRAAVRWDDPAALPPPRLLPPGHHSLNPEVRCGQDRCQTACGKAVENRVTPTDMVGSEPTGGASGGRLRSGTPSLMRPPIS